MTAIDTDRGGLLRGDPEAQPDEAVVSSISVDAVRSTLPDHYRRWVETAILLTGVGYLCVSVTLGLQGRLTLWPPTPDLLMVGLAGVAWAVVRFGRGATAAHLTLGAVWLEAISSFFWLGQASSSSGLALVALLVPATMLMGGKGALVLAVASAIGAPLAAGMGGVLGHGPGIWPAAGVHFSVLAICLVGSAVMLRLLFASLAHLMERAVHQDRRSKELEEQLLHSQKLEAVGRLASGVAHDFNNLLTALAGYADMIRNHEDDEVREIAYDVMELQERGASLTRQLLTFARKDVRRPRTIELVSVIRHSERFLRRMTTERIAVDFELRGPLFIHADPVQVEQVVLNLIANANDAMPEGGVLRVVAARSASMVRLEVIDHGEGMSPEIQERAFEPFFTTKAYHRGTGLGLSTVHGIVSAAGGTVSIESEPNQGTRVVVHFPAVEAPPQLRGREPSRAQANLRVPGWHRILVAEDDVHVHDHVVRILERAGYEVWPAHSGQEALQILLAKGESPDLLLSDLVMPGMTGVELASRVRRRYPELPVLLMSGYVDDALSGGDYDPVEDLVLKPVAPTTLLRRISEKLDQDRRSNGASVG